MPEKFLAKHMVTDPLQFFFSSCRPPAEKTLHDISVETTLEGKGVGWRRCYDCNGVMNVVVRWKQLRAR